MNKCQKMIKNFCNELNIKYTLVSKNWISVLEKDNITKFIAGYKFDINNHGCGLVVDDKYALYEVLKHKNKPIIEHKIIFSNYDKKNIELYFINNNSNVVLKINDGTCGNNVYHITDINELFKKIDVLLIKNFSISICPFYDIRAEYRVIVLNDKPLFSYKKNKPIIVGDGVSNIKDLLLKFNYNYYSNGKHFINQQYDLNYIPKKSEIIEYNWQFNLSKGAIATDIELDKKNDINSFAIDISKSIGFKFGSIDIIETVDNKHFILEINSGVMMENLMLQISDGKKNAYDIYKKGIIEMFSLDNINK